ncbi:MAG: nitrate ABC transporter substrate-binding protein [Thermodesulfobacteriota bacterium]
MKKTLVAPFLLVLALGLLFAPAASGAKKKTPAPEGPVKITTAWLPEFEAFLPWYAKKMGWDKEEGLDLEMLYYGSGEAQLEALAKGEWVLGATDGLTQVLAALNRDVYLIGLTHDESRASVIFAQPDNPIFSAEGWNKDFPRVYGAPELIKGKKALVTMRSPSQYGLAVWLRVFGLKGSDLALEPVDQAMILDAFDAGRGDFACIRTPQSYLAEEKGWEIAGNAAACGGRLANTFLGERKFCDKNPGTVADFLRVCFRVIHRLAEQGPTPEIVDEYMRFYQEWVGVELTLDMAERDLKLHPVWPLAEQIKLLRPGRGGEMAGRQGELAELMTDAGLLTVKELEKVKDARFVTDKFLRKVGQVPEDRKEE